MFGQGYGLSLSDDSCWWLTSDQQSRMWLDRLAIMMELNGHTQNGAPAMIFTKMSNPSDAGAIDGVRSVVRSCLGADCWDDGWSCFDHGTLRMWRHSSVPDVVCEINNDGQSSREIVNMWSSLQPVYQRCMGPGGLPFHAAVMESDGLGVLLAAPSGTGKSTCCRRLPDCWKPLCDDETLVVPGKQKEYWAHPFPTWSEHLCEPSKKTWNVQYSVPICGAFFLEQARADEVVPVGQGEAAILMSEAAGQIYRKFWRKLDVEDERKPRMEIFHNACQVAKLIPAFRLRVSLNGRFWEPIERALEL